MARAGEVTCKFTARIERQQDRYVLEIPESEIEFGTLTPGDICRISVQVTDKRAEERVQPKREAGGPPAPVSVGERLTVEIEDMGDEGDGITRVKHGYVLFVPDTEPGDEVTVEIQNTGPSYGFAEVVEEGTRE